MGPRRPTAVEGIRYGLVIAMAAVGLSLIYGTTGLTNFAHGEIVTFGALITWWLNVSLGIQLIPAVILGVLLSGVFGFVNDRGLWRPLRKRGTGLIAMMIVSIGLGIALQNLFLVFFGGASRPYADYDTQAGLTFGPVSLTPKDIVMMVIAIVILTLAGLALLKTRLGKATRAVSDNPALAASSGIDVERVILVVWISGAALAGLGGVMLAMTQQVSYLMGAQTLLLIFAAVTLGGLGTAFGALVGSLVVGLLVQLSTLWINPELKNVGALVVLILVLLIRPQGILGSTKQGGVSHGLGLHLQHLVLIHDRRHRRGLLPGGDRPERAIRLHRTAELRAGGLPRGGRLWPGHHRCHRLEPLSGSASSVVWRPPSCWPCCWVSRLCGCAPTTSPS